MTAGEAIITAARRLRVAGVPDAVRDARVLLAHASGISATDMVLAEPEELHTRAANRFERLIAKRLKRVPVSHLIGIREFFGYRFRVSRDVLDPRPETETLVEAALSEPFIRLLDIGTGTGCILVTLLAQRSNTTGLGTDISEAACRQARANAALNNVDDRVGIVRTSWTDSITGLFDLIVSNPPYIPLDEWQGLSEEVRLHEPKIALIDFGDGLGGYRAILARSPALLTPGGRFMVEIGPTQGSAVASLFEKVGFYRIACLPDLDGRDRVVVGYRR